MNNDQYERLHAMMYADHETKIYQYEKFKQMYPRLFVHAVLETRPADSSRDYYVPPALREIRPCLVVEKLAWNSDGCRYIACFPFKSYEEPCRPKLDPMQWIRLDNTLYIPACQPACDRGLSLDTRYRDGDCYVSNQAKKLYVMYPERYMGKIAKQVRLKYDDENERLMLDEIYCKAYGLRYDQETQDCYLPSSQYVGELFIGSSVFRRHLLNPNVSKFLRLNINDTPPRNPPPEQEEFEEVWTKIPRSSVSIDLNKTIEDPRIALETDLDPDKSPESIADIATDAIANVAADLGIHVTTKTMKHRWLTTRISSKFARKILVRNGLKHAFLHGAAKSVGSIRAATAVTTAHMTTKAASTLALRSTVSTASSAFAIYGIASLVVDIFDPFEYGRVLNKRQVEEIDRLLDLRYFKTNNFRNVRMTPEDVWNVLQDEEDVEDELTYYGDRFDEYLQALQKVPEHRQFTRRRKLDVVVKKSFDSSEVREWTTNGPHWWLILGLLCASSVWLWRYVEVVALIAWIWLASKELKMSLFYYKTFS